MLYKVISKNIYIIILLLLFFLLLGFVKGESKENRGSSPYLPSERATSEYMLGNISVGIFFIESNATNPPEENTEDWNETEIKKAKSEILQSFHWWEERASENNSYINFSWEFHVRVNVSIEPIKHKGSSSEEGEDLWKWIDEATDSLGFEAPGFDGVIDYINDLRKRMETDWSFAIFVVDSSNDEDNKFSDGKFAFSYLGGPFLVMTLENQNYTLENMDAVCAHEIAHIFFALDEYEEAQEPKDKRTGYLNVANKNSEYGGPAEEESIMRGGVEPYRDGKLSRYARGAVGWWDRDEDGIVDILDTHPETELNESQLISNSSEIFINGSALVQPLPNKNPLPYSSGENISLNYITAVDYQIDGGHWIRSRTWALDGSFGDQIEDFSLRLFLSNGSHLVRVRAVNNVGNVDLSPAEIKVTIDLRKAPEVRIVSPEKESVNSRVVNISWEVSHSEGTVEEVSIYYTFIGSGDGDNSNLIPVVESLPGSVRFYLWKTYTEFNLRDGKYEIVVLALDDAGKRGSNSTVFYLNNPDEPEIEVFMPVEERYQGSIYLELSLRDNDVEIVRANDSFIFEIYLNKMNENVTILLFKDLRLNHSEVFVTAWKENLSEVEEPFPFWYINFTLILNTLSLPFVEGQEIPEDWNYDSLNHTFKPTDGLYSFSVVVKELVEGLQAEVRSRVFILDNPDPPVLRLSLSGERGEMGYYIVREKIFFSAEESYDPDSNNTFLLYSWDFGDGVFLNETSESRVEHIYKKAGNYSFVLKLEDDTGLVSFLNLTIQIHLDYPFDLRINLSEEIEEKGWAIEDQVVLLRAEVSDERFDSEDYFYTWLVYGSGTESEKLVLSNKGEVFRFSLSKAGIYNVVLRGFDSVNNDFLFAETNLSLEIRNSPPVARCVDYLRANPGEPLIFNASLSKDTPSDLLNLSYTWYLNSTSEENLVGKGEVFEYIFLESGEFKVFLKVEDDDSSFDICSIFVKINKYPIAPEIQVEKTSVSPGEELTFKGNLFSFPVPEDFNLSAFTEGLTFSWDFGDGTVGMGKEVSHAFGEAGIYKVRLNVEDNDSLEEEYNAEVNIFVYTLPSANFEVIFEEGSSVAYTNVPVSFNATKSSGNGLKIVKYVWDFGDGRVEAYYHVKDESEKDEYWVGGLEKGKVVSHTYSRSGIYSVKLWVYNEYGGVDSYEITLSIKEKKEDSGDWFSSVVEKNSLTILLVVVIVLTLILHKKKKSR